MNTTAAKKVVADLDRDIAELEDELKKARAARDQVAERYGLSPSRPSRSPTSSDREGNEQSEGQGDGQQAPAGADDGAVRRLAGDPRADRGEADANPPASGPTPRVNERHHDVDGVLWVPVREAGDSR